MLMSIPIRRADRCGFTLVEILVVLAIMALATAIILPSTSRMLDQATAHAVFFDFQRQVSELRREANRTGAPLRLLDPEAAPSDPETDRTVNLKSPWRYTLAPTLEIAPGGVCSVTTANLVNEGRVVMTLVSDGGTCQFIRQQTTAARPPEPSSRK